MLKRLFLLLPGLAVLPVFAGNVSVEAGGSYLVPHGVNPEGGYRLNTTDRNRPAPYVAASYALNAHFDLRLSYTYVADLRSTVAYASPPGSMLQVVVWGHYRDDVHVVSFGPELGVRPHPRVSLTVSPEVNWVASHGTIAFSTHDPRVLLWAPRSRSDSGVTLGAAARSAIELTPRTAVILGYRYLDLEPSFGRRADEFSIGLRWSL